MTDRHPRCYCLPADCCSYESQYLECHMNCSTSATEQEVNARCRVPRYSVESGRELIISRQSHQFMSNGLRKKHNVLSEYTQITAIYVQFAYLSGTVIPG